MYIKNLSLTNFRNYIDGTVKFTDGINVITGANAQGKTNILEAVNYLSTGRSFRSAKDKDMIQFHKDSAHIRAAVISAEREQTLQARFFRAARREIYINDIKIKKLSELSGRLTSVIFGPDDLDIVKDSAAVRRKLMDTCISQLRPVYAETLAEFNKLLKHKSRILKDHHEKPSLLDMLLEYNLRIAEKSAQLIHYRSAFTDLLNRKSVKIHSEFSGDAEVLSITYKTIGGMKHEGKKPSELIYDILAHQKLRYHVEIKSGQILSGAHKDDLEININDMPVRTFASQGQMRTAAVSIKLAERDIHYDERGQYPVLLLDDVLSELDAERRNFILERIKHGQVIITCCNDINALAVSGANIIKIKNGQIVL